MDITTQRKPTTPASIASDSFGSPPGARHPLHRSHPSSVSIASSIGTTGAAQPTTQTSYVHAGSSSPPAGKAELHNVFAHGWQPQPHAHQGQPALHPGMPLGQNKPRLPSFSMHPFLAGAPTVTTPGTSHFNPAHLSTSPPGLGTSGFTSPGLTHNVSFTTPEQAMAGLRVQGLGYFPGTASAVASAVLPQTQRSRSRRSSVGLAVSVSLASRSRSRTATPMGSPPTSPSRRVSKEIGIAQQGQLDRILAGVAATGNAGQASTAAVNNITPAAGGNVFEFTDFGWDEAFEDDDDEGFLPGDHGLNANNKRLVDLVAEEAEDEEESSTNRAISLATLEARARGISIGGGLRKDGLRSRTASRKSTLNQQRDDATLVGPDSARREHKNDMLPLGFKFGAGLPFQGEIIENVDPVGSLKSRGKEVPGATCARFNSPRLGHASLAVGKAFEVVRKLGSGSYAMVYLVKEVGGIGQEYALKCLSKEHLEEEALDVQMFEATIHLSLPKHPNIVTLHQTLQTRKWLFLLLEMCPGEDLFYWLEHSRDSPPETIASSQEDHSHHNYRQPPLSSSNLPSSAIPYSTSAMIAGMGSSMSMSQSPAFTISKSHLSNDHHAGHMGHAGTPTTPSLLAAYSANALLSTRRLKLIASMFGQMCQAVALCHDVGVSHRDIKPENFICCDSEELAGTRDNDYGNEDRKRVIVKLTDFGLATTNEISYDVECGSRPYMAYECRNELGPNYKPKPADVWSLGVVLLNMLFHRNPWTDPTPGNKNFEGFMEDPVEFLLTRFTGIGWEVATYLAERVFTMDVDARVSAAELGRWSKNLPSMIGGRKAVHNLRLSHLNGGPSNKGSLEFTKSPIEPRDMSSALSFKPHSTLSQTAPTAPKTSSSLRAPSIIHEWLETDDATVTGTETVLTPPPTQVPEPSPISAERELTEAEQAEQAKAKRKKRGTRSKNKAAQAAAAAILTGLPSPTADPKAIEKEVVLADLAEASQYLAREISSATKSTDKTRVIDLDEFPKLGDMEAPATLKKSRWKALINSSNGNAELQALMRKVQERDTASAYQSAPAMLQHQGKKSSTGIRSEGGNISHTPSLSVASSSQLSSYNPTASLPGYAGLDSDNWRRSPLSHARHDDLYKGRDAAVSGYHPKSKSKLHSPASSHQESTATVRAPRSPASDVKPAPDTARRESADHQTPRPQHQALPHDARGGKPLDNLQRDIAQVKPVPLSPSNDRPSKTVPISEASAANVPPTKLRMQISSLGKMLSGLKTSTKAKE